MATRFDSEERISEAVSDGLWAMAQKDMAEAASAASPEERINKALEVASAALCAAVGKEAGAWDESARARGPDGKFAGMSARGVERLRARIADIRATMPEHRHESAIRDVVDRTRRQVEGAARARAALGTPEARAQAAMRARETQARNRATPPEARHASNATAANRPPEQRVAERAAPPAHVAAPPSPPSPSHYAAREQALSAAAHLDRIDAGGILAHASNEHAEALQRAGLIERSPRTGEHQLTQRGRNVLEAGQHHGDVVDRVQAAIAQAPAPGVGSGSLGRGQGSGPPPDLEARAQQEARDRASAARNDPAHQAAIRYFHDVETSARGVDRSVVPQDQRRQLMDAGLLQPLEGVEGAHRLTDAGREAGRALAGSGARPSPSATPRPSPSATPAPDTRAPPAPPPPPPAGRTPANPVPAGTPTRGLPDGTYVTRQERPEHVVQEVAPVPLRMVPSTEALRRVWGDQMPHIESLQRVWGDEAGGVTTQLTMTVSGNTATYSGTIHKDGRRVGDVTRSVTRTAGGAIHVSHDLFRLQDAATQGGGAGARMLGQSVLAYRELGVAKVVVHPAWVGPYAWASFGYDAKPREIDYLRSELVPFLTQHGIPLERAREHADNCRSLWHFADLDLHHSGDEAGPGKPGVTIHHVSDERRRDGSNVELDVHLGKKFLLTHRWSEGTIDCRNKSSPTYQRLNARLGLK